ncbi:MAG: histidine kinase [Aeromicrobium sp.]
MRPRQVLAGAVAIAIIGCIPALRALEMLGDLEPAALVEDVAFVVIVLASVLVGWMLAHRRPDNVIGWLLLANGFILVLSGMVDAYPAYARDVGAPGARVVANWSTHGWPLLFAPTVAVAFVLPDGRLPSPRWRVVAALGVVSFVTTLIGGMASHETLDRPYQNVEPLALLPEPVAQVLQFGGLLGMIATLILAAASLAVRFRRAGLEERQQLKWIALAGTFLPVAIIASSIEGFYVEGVGWVTSVSFALAMAAIPLAIGVAVTRYRLFDIDRVISATVAYGLITALLAGGFVAIIVFGGVLLGRGSPIITAAATLAVAVAFRPVRSVVQERVERTFNPTRYRGLHRIDLFLADLRAGRVEPEAIGAAIAEAVPDDSLHLFFWLPDQESHADADGNLVPELPPDPPGQTTVRRGDLWLGTVIHRDDVETRRALEPVLVRAGLAVEIARLRVEVRRQLAEVERSRTRIVTAAMDERRRLERDLHDGAQQQLVSIGLDLRHLQNELGSGSPVQDQLDHSVRRLADAIRELRSLAHGVRPSSLDAGLAPALSELAARTPVRTVLDVTSERFADETEAAAYFVVSEAMANALKHGDPDRIEVRAGRVDGRLVIMVSDDGKGGAVALPGRGLAGIGDRVAALDGDFSIDSPPRGGTKVRVELPCG